MNIQFDSNHFSASTNTSHAKNYSQTSKPALKNAHVLLFGVLAFALSLMQLPLGIFSYMGIDLIEKAFHANPSRLVFLWVFIGVLAFVISTSFAIAACILYKKSEKKSLDTIGFVFSLVSYAINFIAIIFHALMLTGL